MSHEKDKAWLSQQVDLAKKSVDSRPYWLQAVNQFEGRNLPNSAYGHEAPASPSPIELKKK